MTYHKQGRHKKKTSFPPHPRPRRRLFHDSIRSLFPAQATLLQDLRSARAERGVAELSKTVHYELVEVAVVLKMGYNPSLLCVLVPTWPTHRPVELDQQAYQDTKITKHNELRTKTKAEAKLVSLSRARFLPRQTLKTSTHGHTCSASPTFPCRINTYTAMRKTVALPGQMPIAVLAHCSAITKLSCSACTAARFACSEARASATATPPPAMVPPPAPLADDTSPPAVPLVDTPPAATAAPVIMPAGATAEGATVAPPRFRLVADAPATDAAAAAAVEVSSDRGER